MTTPAEEVGRAEIRVEMDTDSAMSALAQFARNVTSRLRSIDTGQVDRGFSQITSSLASVGAAAGPALSGASTGLAAVSVAALASGAAVAALPLAFAGLGAVALRENEQVKNAFADTADEVQATLASAAQPLVPVFIDIADQLVGIVDTLAPNLEAAFSATAPLLEPLVASLGVLAQNAFPGLIAGIEAAEPVLAALGSGLEGLGTAVSLFFSGLATGAEGGAASFDALFGVVNQLLPAIGQFLGQLAQIAGPVLTALTGPLQVLIQNLGAGLQPVIAALGPVLQQAALAFGQVILAVAPLLPEIGQLVASLLPPLVPLIELLGSVFTQLAPVILQVGQTLTAVLAPIIATLPAIITPLVTAITSILQAVLPLVTQILVSLTPALVSLSQTFAQLIVAVTPLIVVIGQVLVGAIQRLTPFIQRVIPIVVRLANVFTQILAGAIRNVVVPAVLLVSNILQGNFRGAINAARALIAGLANQFLGRFGTIRRVVDSAMNAVSSTIRSRLSAARSFVSSALSAIAGFFRTQFSRARTTVSSAISAVVSVLRSLPGRARAALSGAGSALVGAGRDLIRGMVNGIRDAAGSVVDAARGVARSAVDAAENLLGISSPSKVFAGIGRETGRGFIQGLTGTEEQIRRTTQNIAQSITTAFRGRTTGLDDRLVSLVQDGNRRLQGFATERDRLADRIAQAQQRATDIEQQARGVFTLGEAAQAPVFNARRIETELLRADRTIQAFTRNINTLARRGLSRQLLDQIVGLGPEQGAALARSLATQSDSYLQNINRLQGRVNESARNLGRLGADRLFDSGEDAGRGFLAGLRGQRRQIEDLMLSIARGMQRAIRRALRISSPSRVFEDIGVDTIRGLSSGVLQQVGDLRESMRVATDSMIPPGGVLPIEQAESLANQPLGVGALRPTLTGGSVVQINVTMSNEGVLGSREEVLNWLSTSLETLRRERRLPGVA